MIDRSCIFCKIVHGDIKSRIIEENDQLIVIEDIAPKAPIHYLIIPKNHLADIIAISPSDKELCYGLFAMAKKLGQNTPSKAFNLITNNGAAAGQSVLHLHWHFLSGINIYTNGLSL